MKLSFTTGPLILAIGLAAGADAKNSQPAPAGPIASGNKVALQVFDLEWSQGLPFVGASDGMSTATHGYQNLAEDQGPTAMVEPSSGLSLLVLGRTARGYRLGFDEAGGRYLVKLFGAQGNLLRMFVVYPGQDALALPYAKLPGGQVFLTIHNEAGHPLQSFKLFGGADT